MIRVKNRKLNKITLTFTVLLMFSLLFAFGNMQNAIAGTSTSESVEVMQSDYEINSGVATPNNIYYENAMSELVRVNYNQSVKDSMDGNRTLYDAIVEAIINARLNGKSIFVEDMNGYVIDYSSALDVGKKYIEAYDDPNYEAGSQAPDKELVINPDTGEPEEIPMQSGELEVHFINVGQGDAILIKTSEQQILIDGGDRGTTVINYLLDHGVSSLDLVIGTHPHADHIGGLINVMEAIPVGEIIDPGVVHTTKTFEDYLDIIDEKNIIFTEGRAGMTRDLGDGAQMKIVHPTSPSSADLNNASIVTRFTFGQVSFLFTGDAESEAENEMLNSGYILNSTILKVGHHGSSTSTTQAFLNAVNPEVAVIMCGLNNSYGHPHEETLNRLSLANVDIYRTDLHNNIIITTDGVTYDVKTEYDEPDDPKPDIVYITRTGERYHRGSCHYLSRSKIPIERSEAIRRGYTPCKVCKP